MRVLIISAMVFTTVGAFAQVTESNNSTSPCDTYLESTVDSVSGEYTTTSRNDLIVMKDGKKILNIVFLLVDRSIIFSISVIGDVFCVDEANKVTITFRDNTMMELSHNGKFNCDGEFSLFFFGPFGKKKEYLQLATKEIGKIKVGLRKSVIDKNRPNFIEVELTSQNSKEIREIAACLTE